MEKGWKELSAGQALKLEEGQRVDGTFVSIAESKTYPDSYDLKMNVKGETKVMFVNNIVKDLIESNQVKQGQEMALLFVGLKENQSGSRKYKDFKVYVK